MKKKLASLFLTSSIFFSFSNLVLAQSSNSDTSSPAGAAFIFIFMIVWMVIVCVAIVVGIVLLVFTILMIVDVSNREDYSDKTLWILLLVFGLFFGFSIVTTPLYYFLVKKKLDRETTSSK